MARILINASDGRVRRIADDFPADYPSRFPQWDVVDRPGQSTQELLDEQSALLPEVLMIDAGGEERVPAYQSPADGEYYIYEPGTGDFKIYWDAGAGSLIHKIMTDPPTVIRQATAQEVADAE